MVSAVPVMNRDELVSTGSLNWECRIENICKMIASALGTIKRKRHFIPSNIIIEVYNSLVRSRFHYYKLERFVPDTRVAETLSSKIRKESCHDV